MSNTYTEEQIKYASDMQSAIQTQKKFAFATHLLACGKTQDQVKVATQRYIKQDEARAKNIEGFRTAVLGK